MTPEETLDWLAQQHFDQCREERPIQDWIRKMKSQLPEQPDLDAICQDLQEKTYSQAMRIAELEAQLAQLAVPQGHEQKPVAWIVHDRVAPDRLTFVEVKESLQTEVTPLCLCHTTLVTESHKRTWEGLTVGDKMAFLVQDFGGNRLDAMDWAEERLKEKNNG